MWSTRDLDGGYQTDPSRHYVAVTSDVENRLEWHNHEPSGQTVRDRPWAVSVSVEFADEQTAAGFERYPKSGSGRANPDDPIPLVG